MNQISFQVKWILPKLKKKKIIEKCDAKAGKQSEF